jgi:hypothetical protein
VAGLVGRLDAGEYLPCSERAHVERQLQEFVCAFDVFGPSFILATRKIYFREIIDRNLRAPPTSPSPFEGEGWGEVR